MSLVRFRGLGTPLPIYVTRENANGQIAEFTLSAWMILLAMFIVWANVVLWGAYGLAAVVRALL